MATKSMWRLLTVMSAAVFALAIAASAFAQVPPIPHGFYGAGGSAMLDGAPAAVGAVITATNQDGEAVGSTALLADGWGMDVNPEDASSVTFSIDGSDPSDSYEVTQGGYNEVSLNLTSPAPEEPDDADDMGDTDDADDMGDTDDADDMGDTDDADDMGDTDDADDTDAGDGDDADDMGDEPMALPDTGSGGLAGGSSLPVLPLALAISIVVALGGVMAVRRTRA